MEKISIQMEVDLNAFHKDLQKAEKEVFLFVKRVEKLWPIAFDVDEKKVNFGITKIISKAKKDAQNANIMLKPVMSLEEYKEKMKSLEIYARDTKKKIDPALKFELQAKIVWFEDKIKEAKKQLKFFENSTEESHVLKLQIKDYKNNLTEAKRHFNNYVNTWEKELSRLQMKFDQVSKNSFFSKIKSWALKLAWVFWILSGTMRWLYEHAQELADIADSYDAAFAGVRKTIDGTIQDYKKLEDGIVSMSRRIPLTVEQLAEIAATGGQMGIAKENILAFTETVAKLSATVDGIDPKEAATNLARLMAQTKQSISEIENLASSLTYLWNNFKANEWEILNFANEMKAAWGQANMSAQDILAISTAFVDAGIQSEAWGSAVTKAIMTINDAVKTGNEKLYRFAELSNQTAEQFKQSWENDSAHAFKNVLQWISESGDEANTIITELWGSDIRLQKAMLSVSRSGGTLEQALIDANIAFGDNIALQEEAEKKFQTTQGQLLLNQNRWKSWWLETGKVLSSVRLWFSNLFLLVIPGIFSSFSIGLAKFNNFVYQFFLSLWKYAFLAANSINKAFDSLRTIFGNVVENVKIFVNNFGAVLKLWLPKMAEVAINTFVKVIEAGLNRLLSWIEKVKWALGKIPWMKGIAEKIPSSISLGRVRFWWGGWSSQSYVSLNNWLDWLRANYDAKAESISSKFQNLSAAGFKLSAEKQKAAMAAYELAQKSDNIINQTKKQIMDDLSPQEYKSTNQWWASGNTGESGRGGKGARWWRESSKEKIDNIKDEIAAIKERAKTEMEAIEKLAISQEEKIKRKKAIIEKTQNEIDKLSKDSYELEKEQVQELEKIQNEMHKQWEKRFKDGQDIAQKYYDSLIKDAEKYRSELEKIEKKQEELHKKMQEETDKSGEKLADRYVTIWEKIQEFQQKLEESRKNGLNDTVANMHSEKFLKSVSKDIVYWDATGEEILAYKKTLEEIKKLQEEQAYIMKSESIGGDWSFLVNDEKLKQARERVERTQSEKIMAEYEQRQKKLQEELDELKTQAEEKNKIYDEIVEHKRVAEENFTGFIKKQNQERISEMEVMRNKAEEIAQQMAELGFTGQWFKADFVRKNSDGSVSRETKVINYNNVTQTFNSQNTLSERDVYRSTLSGIEKANKGVSNLTTK